MNSARKYINDKITEPPAVDKSTVRVAKYPVISGVVIGAVGGTIGTFLYNYLKSSGLLEKIAKLSDLTLRAINFSYRLPLSVVAVMIGISIASLWYFFKIKK